MEVQPEHARGRTRTNSTTLTFSGHKCLSGPFFCDFNHFVFILKGPRGERGPRGPTGKAGPKVCKIFHCHLFTFIEVQVHHLLPILSL